MRGREEFYAGIAQITLTSIRHHAESHSAPRRVLCEMSGQPLIPIGFLAPAYTLTHILSESESIHILPYLSERVFFKGIKAKIEFSARRLMPP
jgi:hypothetical protein